MYRFVVFKLKLKLIGKTKRRSIMTDQYVYNIYVYTTGYCGFHPCPPFVSPTKFDAIFNNNFFFGIFPFNVTVEYQ